MTKFSNLNYKILKSQLQNSQNLCKNTTLFLTHPHKDNCGNVLFKALTQLLYFRLEFARILLFEFSEIK